MELVMPVRPDWADPDRTEWTDDTPIFWSAPAAVGDVEVSAAWTPPADGDPAERGVWMDGNAGGGEPLSTDEARQLAAELIRLADLLDATA